MKNVGLIALVVVVGAAALVGLRYYNAQTAYQKGAKKYTVK